MKHIKTFRKLFENLQNLESSIILDSVELSEEYDQLKKLGWIDINITDTYIEFRNYHLENPRDVKFPIFRIYMSDTDNNFDKNISELTYKLLIKTSKDSKFRGMTIDKDSSNILPPHKTPDDIEFEKATGESTDMDSRSLEYYNDYISKIKGLIKFTNSKKFDDIIGNINMENNEPHILRMFGMTQDELDNPGSIKDVRGKMDNVMDRLFADFDFLKTNQNIDHEKLEDILDLMQKTRPLSNREINELIDIALENKDYDRIEILRKYLK
jgi:hypothetical protein